MKKLALFVICYLLFVILALPAFAQEGTEPGETVRDKVREKIEILARQPRAYVGEIMDLPDSIIELKIRTGEMRQIKTDENTAIIAVKGETRRAVKFSDLAVGDWAIAMGYLGDNNVFTAERVITTGTSPLITRRAVYGEVTSEAKGTFTIKHPKTGETWEVKTTKKTKVTTKSDTKIVEAEIDDIGVGDRIIAGGTPVEDEVNTLEARIVHLIPSPTP